MGVNVPVELYRARKADVAVLPLHPAQGMANADLGDAYRVHGNAQLSRQRFAGNAVRSRSCQHPTRPRAASVMLFTNSLHRRLSH